MNFVSFEFILFISLIFSIYYFIPHRLQNLLLLAGSYFFYGWWDWRFLSLIFISSVVDFFCGLLIDKERYPDISEKYRKVFLFTSITVNLGMLGFFKYFNFFTESLVLLTSKLGFGINVFTLNIILPVGISFYTFQTMSYTIDIYRNEFRSTNRFIDYMLYVSFFTQLVAGPIERAKNLFPQILEQRTFRKDNFFSGIQLAFFGFFKKIVIADNLALIADSIFSQANPSGPAAIIATYAFAFQIYCDFSGYTDIARGIARMLGFDLMLNFRLPYLATNPRDFWQRWHISLSSWLKDYLYISLGGNRSSNWFTYRNLMITMLLAGLWHGASWNYVVWGLYHGLILCLFRFFFPGKKAKEVTFLKRSNIRFWLSVVFYFQITCLGWLIFRIQNMGQLIVILKTIITHTSLDGFYLRDTLRLFVLTAPLIVFQIYQHFKGLEPWRQWPVYLKSPFYCSLIYLIIVYGNPKSQNFIYFQF